MSSKNLLNWKRSTFARRNKMYFTQYLGPTDSSLLVTPTILIVKQVLLRAPFLLRLRRKYFHCQSSLHQRRLYLAHAQQLNSAPEHKPHDVRYAAPREREREKRPAHSKTKQNNKFKHNKQ